MHLGFESTRGSRDLDDGELAPLTENEEKELPDLDAFKYSVSFDVEDYNTETYSFELDECDQSGNNGIVLQSQGFDGFEIGSDEVDYICYDPENDLVYYEIDNDEFTADLEDVNLVNGDFEYELTWNDDANLFYIGKDGIKVWVSEDYEFLGNLERDSEVGEVTVQGRDISTWDKDAMLDSFVVVKEHEDEDEFEFIVPDDDNIELDLVIKGYK